MEWAAWAGTLGAKIAGKMALNTCVPGLGSIIDFGEAAKCFYNGDVCGGMISTVSGVADLATLGLVGATKEAMKESAKKAVVQSAKDTAKSAAKEASRKVGQDLGKQLAMGTTKFGKDEAIKMAMKVAELASKKATRKVGQEIAKELAKDVTTEAVEQAFHVGTKMTVNKLLQTAGLAAVSSGGRQVWKTILEDFSEKLILEAWKRYPNPIVFELILEAAKKGAEEEFKKRYLNLIAKDVGVSALKGTINYFSGSTEKENEETAVFISILSIYRYEEQLILVPR